MYKSLAKRLITVQTIMSGHMTGIITQTKESETVHFNTEMLDSNDSNDFQMCIHVSISNYTYKTIRKIADFFSCSQSTQIKI